MRGFFQNARAGPAQAAARELLEEALQGIERLEAGVAAWELRRLLSGRYDAGPALVSVQAGAGGDDAMDWAAMLANMYARWFAARGWDAREVDRVPGDIAGVKSVDFEVRGRFAFGTLYAEKGTHRLVRQSPFNAKAARQTSFAAVDVSPLLDEARRPA